VQLRIYDISGREILTLVNEKLKAGNYSLSGMHQLIRAVVYFYRITTDAGFTETRKMILVK